MAVLFLIAEEFVHCLPWWLHHFTLPTTVNEGHHIFFLHIFANTFYLLSSFLFLGGTCMDVEVPRLGVESELHPLAYTTATATPDPSCIYDLHHSSWQCRIPNLLNESRDQTCTLMDFSRIHFHCTTLGNPLFAVFLKVAILTSVSW